MTLYFLKSGWVQWISGFPSRRREELGLRHRFYALVVGGCWERFPGQFKRSEKDAITEFQAWGMLLFLMIRQLRFFPISSAFLVIRLTVPLSDFIMSTSWKTILLSSKCCASAEDVALFLTDSLCPFTENFLFVIYKL